MGKYNKPHVESSLKIVTEDLRRENDELKGTVKSLYRHYCDMADIARKLNNNVTEYIQLKEREAAILKDRRFLESQMQSHEHIVRIGSKTCISEAIEKAFETMQNDDDLPF